MTRVQFNHHHHPD
ncbi:TPA: his operon leader peptide [Escherichia coli]|nr:his operon leader peptide [Escherichia coli]